MRAAIIQDRGYATMQANDHLGTEAMRMIASDPARWHTRDGEHPSNGHAQALPSDVREHGERPVADVLPEPELDQGTDGGLLHGRDRKNARMALITRSCSWSVNAG